LIFEHLTNYIENKKISSIDKIMDKRIFTIWQEEEKCYIFNGKRTNTYEKDLQSENISKMNKKSYNSFVSKWFSQKMQISPF
jgi:hypothetical protein